MRPILYPAFSMIVAATVAGCAGSSDGLARQAISGEVKLDGQPVPDAAITFVPVGFEGPPAGAAVEGGAYSVPAENGPIPGNHRVEVYARKPTGRIIRDAFDPSTPIDEMFESIPTRYNVKSELKANVTDGGDNHFAFELTGEIKTPPPAKKAGRR